METRPDFEKEDFELREAGRIANLLNAIGLASGPSLGEQWRISTDIRFRKHNIPCVELTVYKGLQSAEEIREQLARRKITAAKDSATLYTVYGTGRPCHQIQVPLHEIDQDVLFAYPAPASPVPSVP